MFLFTYFSSLPTQLSHKYFKRAGHFFLKIVYSSCLCTANNLLSSSNFTTENNFSRSNSDAQYLHGRKKQFIELHLQGFIRQQTFLRINATNETPFAGSIYKQNIKPDKLFARAISDNWAGLCQQHITPPGESIKIANKITQN